MRELSPPPSRSPRDTGARAPQIRIFASWRQSRQVQDRQVRAPRADSVGVVLRHRLHCLMQMVEVVYHPGGEKLAQCDTAELRMLSASLEVLRRDEAVELVQIRLPGIGERGHQ